jgi:hypothetical protein
MRMPNGDQEFNKADETASEEGSTQETNNDETMGEEDASQATEEQTSEKQAESKDEYSDELAEKLARAEKKIVKLKQAGKGVDPEELAEKVWERIDSRLAERELKTQKSAYDNAVKSVSTSESEEKLIRFHLENSIKPTGNIEEDIESAKLLANRKKILKTNEELARSLRVRSTIQTAPSFSGSKTATEDKPELSAAEKKLLNWVDKQVGK